MATHLDGNMLGGLLSDVFAMDMTMAVTQCNSCGRASVLGEAMVYPDAPGLVVRCPTCDEIMMRAARGEGRAWLDLRGMSWLQVGMPGDA